VAAGAEAETTAVGALGAVVAVGADVTAALAGDGVAVACATPEAMPASAARVATKPAK
jgi:hypothetical protein